MLLYFFFFFKQKTAYEMRISDWSSDVCSSDLASVPARRGGRALDHGRVRLRRAGRRLRDRLEPDAAEEEPRRRGDRKSVVSGKSVSVRVDLGGRRIIKKKTNESNTSHFYLMSHTTKSSCMFIYHYILTI